MRNPKIMCAEYGVRSDTDLIANAEMTYVSGALGDSRVRAYLSRGDEDRGGFVLDLLVEDNGGSLIPFCQQIPNGVRLHVAGDAESAAMFEALMGALRKLDRFIDPIRRQGIETSRLIVK